MAEIFTARELFDPFGIRRHGEMKVVLASDHAAKVAELEREIERLKAYHQNVCDNYEIVRTQAQKVSE